MVAETLEEGLTAFRCPESHGIFIPAESYWRWLHQQPSRLPHLPAPSDKSPVIEDSPEAKICPETGLLMMRYRVGHGFDFYIDRSPTGSLWLDAGEWEALKERQFHDELHLIFTSPWQRDVLQQDIAAAHEERLADRLGPDLMGRLVALRQDLNGHPDKDLAMALFTQVRA